MPRALRWSRGGVAVVRASSYRGTSLEVLTTETAFGRFGGAISLNTRPALPLYDPKSRRGGRDKKILGKNRLILLGILTMICSGGVPREQKMLKGHLPRVTYHRVYSV